MKKLLFVSLVAVFLITGCKKQELQPITSEKFQIVGQEHNKLIQLYMNYKKETKLTDQEIYDQVLIPQLAQDFNISPQSLPNYTQINSILSNYNLLDYNSLALEFNLSENDVTFLEQLGHIIRTQYFTDQLEQSMQQLNQDISQSQNTDKPLLYSANSTAVYSNELWQDYAAPKGPDWSVVLAYDVAGAIVGFASSAGNLAITVGFSVVASLKAYKQTL